MTGLSRIGPPALLVLVGCANAGTPVASDEDGGVGRASAPLQQTQETGATLPVGYLSLTYDDGPGYATVPIATYLANQGIPATFFINGCRLEEIRGCPPPYYTEATLGTLITLGHRVANHTMAHEGLPGLSAEARRRSITSLQPTVDRYVEDGVWLFRPPGNDWPVDTGWLAGDPVLARLLGPVAHTIPGPWNGGAQAAGNCRHDWACLDPWPGGSPPGDGAACAQQMLACDVTQPGRSGVVQLHDRRPTHIEADPSYRDNPIDFTRTLIPGLLARGFTFVPLDAIPGLLGRRRFDFAERRHTSAEFSDSPGGWSSAIYSSSLRLGDVNGDGDLEVCGRGNTGIRCVTFAGGRLRAGATVTSSFSNAQGFAEARFASTMMMGDIDRDGDDDVCMRGPANGIYCARAAGRGAPLPATPVVYVTLSSATGWGSSEADWTAFRLVDVNGDGRADLCGRTGAGIVCSLSTANGTRFGDASIWTTELGAASPHRAPMYSSTLAFGDVDGDGLPDACFRTATGLRCARHRGFYFEPSRLWLHGRFSDGDRWNTADTYGSIRLVDLDGDGDADVCGRATTGVVCAFSNRTTFRPYQYFANEWMTNARGWNAQQYGATLLFGDLDRDGVADVCGRSAGGLDCALGQL
ncbi:MAG: VCBS repeat-containing protein [Sandaracinaceae bacterium]|nr:VCBS repeat-containing protein [Sandaracinaceae bacterium]